MSTTIALSLIDQYGHDLEIHVSPSFNLHFVDLTRSANLTVALQLQMRPVNLAGTPSPAYWLIYRFNTAPQLNSSVPLIDGWTLWCPTHANTSQTHDLIYTYQIGNEQVAHHRSVIFGVREASNLEQDRYCTNHTTLNDLPSLFDGTMNFSLDYELRTFTSGCYYLDEHNGWRSDGLQVSLFLMSEPSRSSFTRRLGRIIDRFQADTMFFYTFDNVCGQFLGSARTHQLELCVCQR
jgi:hypothetical protein